MAITRHSSDLKRILRLLDSGDIARLKHSSRKAAGLEREWRRRAQDTIEGFTDEVLKSINRTGDLPDLGKFDFVSIFVEHYFDVTKESLKIAEGDYEKRLDPETKLRGPVAGRIPRSLKELMKLYDLWRRKKLVPKRAKVLAEKVKKKYLEKVQDVWKRRSEDFRKGDEYTQQDVRREIQKAAETTYARAKTIVDTETTYYYNKARRETYDRSSDVVAYLYVAIRDHATTKWCRSRTGLVYHRADGHIDSETPPVHWNCRSEILPLVRQNPNHLRLIENPMLNRKYKNPEPLPAEWSRGAA